MGKNLTVNELIARYLKTKTGVKPNTLANYNFVQNIMNKEEFGNRKIARLRHLMQNYFLLNCNRMEKVPVRSKPSEVF